ncbi:RecQ-mediated genome instability protein 1 [Symbiodinium microadriaticum]|uniref:RecQ-mediated genome instability protein 1 n=1 Tax=Symbiodinium microadriaticum TaxID=2951 RepID=A0A1Q9DWM3_SYMMI|nr:RecQ-mediated genome instability protein 1 [Symbiodinium microadriaticum]
MDPGKAVPDPPAPQLASVGDAITEVPRPGAMDPGKAVPDPPVQLATAELEESKDAPLSEQQREELTLEIQRLKEAKQQAVEEEEYEEAAALKRRIKVLEDTLGEAVRYEARANRPPRQDSSASPPKATPKPLSQRLPGEDLWQMPSENMKLVEEERIFLQKSKMAMRQKGVTDDTVQGVPVWAYEPTPQQSEPQALNRPQKPSHPSMADFGFLSAAWGVELTEASKAEISEQGYATSRKDIQDYIKDSDLRKLKHSSQLPKEITRINSGEVSAGQYLVQIQKVADITQPTKFQEDFEGGKWRLLALDLAAGDQKFKAIEFRPVKDLSGQLPPGTKLLLYSTGKETIRIQNGHLLLVPAVVEVLGGYVEQLVASWKADKEVKETRLLWRTDGIKKAADGLIGSGVSVQWCQGV